METETEYYPVSVVMMDHSVLVTFADGLTVLYSGRVLRAVAMPGSDRETEARVEARALAAG